MVEEPQHCFSRTHLDHEIVVVLVPTLLTTCNSGGYGCPLGCKGKKGCGIVECEMRPRLDRKGEPIANICLSTLTGKCLCAQQ